jgi:hypothetical protein
LYGNSFNIGQYLNQLFEILNKIYQKKHEMEMKELSDQLGEISSKLKHFQHLTNKLIHIYSSFHDIDCILIGMNKPMYVKDVMLNLNEEMLLDEIELKNIFNIKFKEIEFIENLETP